MENNGFSERWWFYNWCFYLTFFRRKPFGLLSWVSVHFLNKELTWGKPSTNRSMQNHLNQGSYHMEFRNTLTAAQAITGKRLDKVGWIESHNYHKCLIKYWKPWTLIIGDSIAKGDFYRAQSLSIDKFI